MNTFTVVNFGHSINFRTSIKQRKTTCFAQFTVTHRSITLSQSIRTRRAFALWYLYECASYKKYCFGNLTYIIPQKVLTYCVCLNFIIPKITCFTVTAHFICYKCTSIKLSTFRLTIFIVVASTALRIGVFCIINTQYCNGMIRLKWM